MPDWVRVDADFGVPGMRFCVAFREPLGREILQALKDASPDTVATYLEREIVAVRPQLIGAIVVSISYGPGGMSFVFDVVHPSLPRAKLGEWFQEVLLRPCPTCGKDVLREKQWRTFRGGREVVCCSEECGRSYEADSAIVRGLRPAP